MKRQLTDWEKISANHIYVKELFSKDIKNSYNFNVKNPNNPIKKWAKDLNRHLTKKDIRVTKEHMQRCSALNLELQIKTTMRYQHTHQVA